MAVTPYKIIHLDISKEVKFVPADETCGLYFIFWWKDIPVGDWYVQKDDWYDRRLFENQVRERSQKAIRFIKAAASATKKNSDASVSVVICTRNRTKDLEKCLHALQKQICLPAEIV